MAHPEGRRTALQVEHFRRKPQLPLRRRVLSPVLLCLVLVSAITAVGGTVPAIVSSLKARKHSPRAGGNKGTTRSWENSSPELHY